MTQKAIEALRLVERNLKILSDENMLADDALGDLGEALAALRENGWQPIETFDGKDVFDLVDLWLTVAPSPRSMGWGDSFRVTDCWRDNGKWFHARNLEKEELYLPYVTYWRPLPDPPASGENVT